MANLFENFMLTIILMLVLTMVPRIVWAYLKVEESWQHHDLATLHELQHERNTWLLRHFSCGAAAMLLLWILQAQPALEISHKVTVAVGIYAGCCLVFAALECLLWFRIHRYLSLVPVKVTERNQR
ncbi:hypothetical protein GMLC_05890 [Geomonas limicola]|uniref:Uncharacterized protein n=1 Tax=Geomonas limicola TaxID=2740186 RepID=A0A6V8N3S3_9BACT|nr:hypothetical protein [Geomonas limicola]GFO67010.1 hypothetical protein GMLC_05890 [Geomonas limicola]